MLLDKGGLRQGGADAESGPRPCHLAAQNRGQLKRVRLRCANDERRAAIVRLEGEVSSGLHVLAHILVAGVGGQTHDQITSTLALVGDNLKRLAHWILNPEVL